jgi:dTDP-glucose 4,6-dehydratase
MAHELELDLQHVLRHTQSVWPSLAGSNVLITGATGFVGKWLLESFLWANEQLGLNARPFVLTRNPHAFSVNRSNLEVLTGDLKTFHFPSQQFHYVIHAAMEHETPCQDGATTLAANLDGTRRILELAQTHGTQRVLFTSSGAVYGEQPPDLANIPEDFVGTLQPRNLYEQSKRESEILFVQSTPRAVIARLFAFIGPYLPVDKNFAVGNFVRDALLGGPIRIDGDGTPLRSYLYAADLAIWLWTILLSGESARPYNVGSDQPVSILDLAKTVEQVCGVTKGISIAKTPTPGEKPKRYVPSIDRARSELDLQPLISLDEGIRRMFQWHQSRYTSTK